MTKFKIMVIDHSRQQEDARFPPETIFDMDVKVDVTNECPTMSLVDALRKMYPSKHVEITCNKVVEKSEPAII